MSSDSIIDRANSLVREGSTVPPRSELVGDREGGVLGDAASQDKALVVPVLGDVPDSGVQRVWHAAGRHRPPMHGDRAAAGLPHPGECLTECGVAAGRGSGEAEHLAGADLKVQRLELALQGEPFGAQDGLHRRVPHRCPVTARVPGGGSAALLARHRRDQFGLGEVGDRSGQNVACVAVDGDGGAQVVHLLQMMGDEQERHSLALQFPELVEEPPDAAGVELGGRFVQDDQPGAEGQRPRDLDELPLLHGQIPGPGVGVDLDAVLGEELLRTPAEPSPADPPRLVVQPAEEEVLGDGQIGDDHGLLVDARDLRLPGRGVPEGRARAPRRSGPCPRPPCAVPSGR
ncbi:hypothetical protein GCM10018966_036780 [Streptomyces yanii]